MLVQQLLSAIQPCFSHPELQHYDQASIIFKRQIHCPSRSNIAHTHQLCHDLFKTQTAALLPLRRSPLVEILHKLRKCGWKCPHKLKKVCHYTRERILSKKNFDFSNVELFVHKVLLFIKSSCRHRIFSILSTLTSVIL